MYSFEQKLEFGVALHLRLFSNVKNTRELRSGVMSGQLLCALIKPKLLVDPFQLVIAANKAVVRQNVSSLVTKSIYTEILFNLSPSKNITQGLTKFGVGDDDTDIFVLVIPNSDEELQEVLRQVDGEMRPIEDAKEMLSINEVIKTYSIHNDELAISNLLDSVVTRIAAKDCL